jgi:hypothetical protein
MEQNIEVSGLGFIAIILVIMMFDGCDYHAKMEKLVDGQNQALWQISKELRERR